MPRVLLVSYYTPPRSGVATSRTRQLMGYLPEHGWDVTAFTAALPQADQTVIQSEYVDLPGALKGAVGLGRRSAHETLSIAPAPHGTRRSFRQAVVAWGYRLTSYPDPHIGWLVPGRRALRDTLAAGRYDAVLSSSPPFTTDLMVASVMMRIPWVADYRDLWGDSDYYSSRVRRYVDRWLERWTLRRVSALTTVSEPLANVLRSHRGGISVDVVPNAFDEREWRDVPFEGENRTTFVYAGQLFGGRRDPRPLFRAVRSLLDSGELEAADLRIDFYSVPESWLAEAIAQTKLTEVVRVKGLVSREEVMRAERRADRLLMFLWDGPNTEGIVTGKLFEYLGAQRRILAVGGPSRSAVDGLLSATDAGVRARDESSIRAEVLLAVAEHRAAMIRRLAPAKVAPYSAYEMARAMARVLDRVTGTRPHAPASEPATAVRYSP